MPANSNTVLWKDWQFLAAFALVMAAPLWFNMNAKGLFFWYSKSTTQEEVKQ
jgi:hypothetical protein